MIGTALIVLLQFSPAAGTVLEFERTHLLAQPWRLLTAHWVHINWLHALLNGAAWCVVARLFSTALSAPRHALVVLVASVAVSAGLALFYPKITWYRGFSGVLHALFLAGAMSWSARSLLDGPRRLDRLWMPAVLLGGGWLKVVIEQPGHDTIPYAEWLGAATVPQAHLIGAICGSLLGLLFATVDAARRNRPNRPAAA